MFNSPKQPLTPLAQETFRWDLLRGFFRGVQISGTQTFFLFIAIRYFHADLFPKSMIASAPYIGMIFSMILFHYASTTELKKSVCASIPVALCGTLLVLSAASDSIWPYTLCVVSALVLLNSNDPFMTSMYNDNYPANQRGALYSKVVRVMVLTAVLSGFFGSSLLDHDPDFYLWILIILGLAAFGNAYALWQIPSKQIETHNHTNPFTNLKLLWEDRSFGYVLLTWFIMGFGSLWVLPLRVDYLTSSTYGIKGSALLVTTLITIIPEFMRAISAPLLAKLFDRLNFILLRMIINITLGCGIAIFFLTKDPFVIAIGSILIGIAFGGGSVAWGLWVTKYAPPGKVGAYMSVHVFLTGVRGTIGPLIGFWTVRHIGPTAVGMVSLSLMILATLMLIPEIGKGRKKTIPASQVPVP